MSKEEEKTQNEPIQEDLSRKRPLEKLEGETAAQEPAAKRPRSLFGDIIEKQREEKERNQGVSLFHAAHAPKTSLFGDTITQKKDQTEDHKGSSLFDVAGKAKTSLFGNTHSALFSDKPISTILSAQSVGSTLFNATPVKAEKGSDEEDQPEEIAEPKLEEAGFDVLYHDSHVGLFHKVGDSFVNKGPGTLKILRPKTTDDEKEVMLLFRMRGSGHVALQATKSNIVVGEPQLEMSRGMKGMRLAALQAIKADANKPDGEATESAPAAENDKDSEKPAAETEKLNELELFIIKFENDESRVKTLEYISNKE